jgi:hypothetical protein
MIIEPLRKHELVADADSVEDVSLTTARVEVGHELHCLDGVLAVDGEDVRLVWMNDQAS